MRIGFVALCFIAATSEAVNLKGKPQELTQADGESAPLCNLMNWLTTPIMTCGKGVNVFGGSGGAAGGGCIGNYHADTPAEAAVKAAAAAGTPVSVTPQGTVVPTPPVVQAPAPPAPKVVDKKGNPVPVVTDPATG